MSEQRQTIRSAFMSPELKSALNRDEPLGAKLEANLERRRPGITGDFLEVMGVQYGLRDAYVRQQRILAAFQLSRRKGGISYLPLKYKVATYAYNFDESIKMLGPKEADVKTPGERFDARFNRIGRLQDVSSYTLLSRLREVGRHTVSEWPTVDELLEHAEETRDMHIERLESLGKVPKWSQESALAETGWDLRRSLRIMIAMSMAPHPGTDG